MIENDYLLAWAVYGIAALGCLLVWFRLTRWMWRWLCEPLRVAMTVLLLTPTVVDPGKELFAPAIAITALDLLFGVGNNAWRAVADLVLYGLIAMAVYLLAAGLRWLLWRRQGLVEASPAGDGNEPTLRERMARGEFGGPQGLRAGPRP
ncbi:MAG: hypothetical protein A2002_13040 [Pseudomonadales bacterium GWC1_66_9]|jgi:hypothetical protein|uniref:Major facilitator superfamily permease n=2 Tax=Azotobacter chroococcum TaxID=353 RepID=A0A0C4WHM7_9GAMM|nr:hypothetical protein [Azotobacter chroococcum]AJE21103.1 Major facilitator superfamily permease [Azotobacter chroococcum NCIMB 8003]OHC11794.1 MAG: hypothetical protein A2002_13040 [Pseudomonadales bacterium GWC1_66_9]QQE87344.1 hypothetical protein GKQ51_13615 [Azotobacter chroococcum]TBW11039.1 hypothetical protein E0E52_00920 [Azotobacter chroococcum]